MIFVDTGAFFSLYVTSDSNHARARIWFKENQVPLVTTEYVVVETLNLFRARRQFIHAQRLNRRFRQGRFVKIEWVTKPDFAAASQVFDQFRDKAWSLTDCVSRVVMERLRISTAFSFDEHFRQFGTVYVVP
jgi:predicted nucleic acid-binding protein